MNNTMTATTLDAAAFMEDAKLSYAAKNAGFITASKCKIISQCPWTYNEKYEKDNPDFAEEETAALGMGNMVDFFASYGEDAFYDRYEILAPKAKRDFTAEKTQITNGDGKKILPIFDELKRQPLFRFMDPAGTRQRELKGVFNTPDGPVKIKGTPDTIFYDEEHIDDTKTIGLKNGNTPFEKACKYNIRDYDYVFSMAFYAVLYYLEKGKLPKKLTLSFVGTNSGFKFLQYEIPREEWEPQVEKIKQILCFYAKCKAADEWPNGVEINTDDIFRHLKCPFYDKNPGAIQKNPIPYFPDNYDN